MNEDNLKPFKKGEQRAREAGKKGGKAHKQAVSLRKRIKEIFYTLSKTTAPKDKIPKMMQGETDILTCIIYSLMNKAMNGDIQATKLFFDMVSASPDIALKEKSLKIQLKDLRRKAGYSIDDNLQKTVIYLPNNNRTLEGCE